MSFEFQYEDVFILGAGASKPYGYPTGYELRNVIWHECCEGQGTTYSRLLQLGWPEAKIKSFGSAFRASLSNSIDDFLTKRPDMAEIGKAAIAIKIMEIESKPVLHYPTSKNWIQYLINMRYGTDLQRLSTKPLNVLTFNYDRSFEHIFYNAVKERFGLNDGSTQQHLQTHFVHHMYGSLGCYPFWGAGECPIEFDAAREIHQPLHTAAGRIRVIPDDRSQFERPLIDYVWNAKRVYILGFGFDETNLKRLGINWDELPGKLYATAFGLTEGEIIRVKKRLGLKAKAVYIEDIDCEGLLRKYLI